MANNRVELVILMRDGTRQGIQSASAGVDGLSADYEELVRAIRASEAEMERSGQTAGRMVSDYDKMQSVLMKIGGTTALIGLGKEIINVRGEIEMMEKSLTVLLGSKEKADVMLADIKNLAVKSPLSLTDVSKAAQTLLGFNIEAQRVMPTLEQIGNIAMGDAQKFSSLTLAFAQMDSTGKLMGQDLLQMINAGFNPLSVISEKTGKSIGELKKEMEDGAISSKMVAEAFASATAEGEKFHGMLEAQAEGIEGLKASLGDAWTSMLNEIGKGQQDIISEGYKLTTTLVQNYETVGKILLSLIATYGTYKTAVVLATAAEKGWTVAQLTHYNVLLLVEKAQKLLNKTMLANPYVLVATAVIGLATAVWALSKNTNEQTESLKRLKNLQGEYTQSIEKEKVQLDILFGRLKAAKEGTEDYEKAKDNIIAKYGSYLDGLSEEIRTLKDVEAAYKAISAAAIQAAKDRAIEKGTQDAVNSYTEVWGKNIGKIRDKFLKQFGEARGELLMDSLKESLQSGSALNKEVQDAIAQFDKTVMRGGMYGMGQSYDTENDIAEYIGKISFGKKVLDKEVKEIESIFGKATKKDENNNQQTVFSDINKELKTAQDNVDTLKKKLSDLRSGKTQSTNYAKDIEDTATALDKAEKKLASLTGRDKKTVSAKTKASDKAKKDAQEQADILAKMANNESKASLERRQTALDNEQKLLDIQKDGWDKRQKQIELDYKKELIAIDKHAQELIEKQQEAERLQWEKGGKKGTFVPTTTGVLQLPREQKNELIAQEATLNKVTAAETAQMLKDMLEPYRTFAQQRIDIEKKYQEDIAALRKSGASEENIQVAEREQTDALAALDEEMAQKEETFKALMMRIGDMSLQQLEKALKEAEKALKESETTSGKDSKQTGVLRSKIKKLQEEIKVVKAKDEVEKDNDVEKWKRESKAIRDCKKEIDGMLDSMDFLDESTRDALKAASNIADGAIAMIEGIRYLGTSAAASISAVEKASVILAIVGAAVQIITAIFNMASASEKRHQEALAEVQKNRIAMQREYNLLLLEQNLLLEEATGIFGEKQIEKAANAMKVYAEAVAQFGKELKGDAPTRLSGFLGLLTENIYKKQLDAYNKGIGALNQISVKTGHHKTGLFGWGKGEDEYTSILDLYDDILTAEGKLNIARAKAIIDTQTMSDADKERLQYLIDLQEKAEEAQEALRDYLQETFGVLGEDLMDSIVASIQDKGVNAWEAFGDAGSKVIEDLGKQLAYELFFAKRFSKLQEDLEAVYGKTSDPEEIAAKQLDLVGQFYNAIGQDMEAAKSFMENWQKKAKEYGFDIWQSEGSSQSGKAGAFTTMTQDQGTKLEGLFTSVQNHTASIDEQVTDMSKAMFDSLDCLFRIEENTSYCKLLKDIQEDTRWIKNNGLKMK